jgi:AcrR family transcriptional regulator/DNA-binding MarR family transcriptional regulator
VSRRTFYELFSDREDCFLAAFERALSLARERVLNACEGQRSWRERIRAGLIAFLGLLEDEPRLGRVLVCESVAGGPRVLARRAETIDLIARTVDEGRSESKGAAELSPLTAEGVVGGALGVIGARLLAQSPGPNAARGGAGNATRKGRGRPLLEFAGPLVSTIVLPYLGPGAARRELTRAVAHSAPRTVNGSPATVGMLLADPFKAPGMRLTYRTVRVLMAIAEHERASNRLIGVHAGIADQGQMSKLLSRLERLGLVENVAGAAGKGAPNAWSLAEKGREVHKAIETPRGGTQR